MGNRDPRVDAYIDKAPEFARPILVTLREAVHTSCPEAEETLKWRSPSFLYRGKILCGMSAFKQHVAFGFWKYSLIDTGDEGKQGDAMGQFGRITAVKDLPSKRDLARYVKQAMALEDAGVKAPRTKSPRPKVSAEPPADLAKALARNKKARLAFEAFSPSHRREYVEWITEAKRPETRERRIAQAVEWMAEGKSRNWKYM
jgi:uncharacterized protein YdeI (YjbR/CyaY-like superfamily)